MKMEDITAMTGLTSTQIAKGSLSLGVLFVMFGLGQIYITCLLGVVYPVLMSILALDNKKNEDDDKQWLTYWVVFGLFNIVDQFAYFILHYIPFYHFLKLCFLVFLFLPQIRGATMVYNAIILPYFGEIDAGVSTLER